MLLKVLIVEQGYYSCMTLSIMYIVVGFYKNLKAMKKGSLVDWAVNF